ncbi:hypothetical protein OG21DRAFT_1491694 [Imleria badia]|nr:hypothetical protein OG21DRAFT_1491694 [Imleria badia]
MIHLAECVNRKSTHLVEVQEKDDGSVGGDQRAKLSEVVLPTVILDRSGKVLVWYLPDAVSPPNQWLMWDRLSLQRQPLSSSISSSGLTSWWTASEFFRMDADLKGVINLSPAWFQQG